MDEREEPAACCGKACSTHRDMMLFESGFPLANVVCCKRKDNDYKMKSEEAGGLVKGGGKIKG